MKLSDIKGLGPKTLDCLKNLDIKSIDDLVNYYPYRHDIIVLNDIKEVEDKQNVIIECIVDSVPLTRRFRANMTSLTFRAMSNKKMIAVVIFNRAFLKKNCFNFSIKKFFHFFYKKHLTKYTFYISI